MKVFQRYSYVDVVGSIWMPNVTCSMRYDLRPAPWNDVNDVRGDDGTITRDSVEQWLATHAGDFQSIQDFSASIEDGEATIDIPWATEDGELAYLDSQ